MRFLVGGRPPGRPPFVWTGAHQTMDDLKNVRCLWRGREVVVKGMYGGGGEEQVWCWIRFGEWNTCMTRLEELEPLPEEIMTCSSIMPTSLTYSHLELMDLS